MSAMEGEYRLSSQAAAAIRLLLLSGCRKSEILTLRWAWVDFERRCLRLPDSKTGAKVVPLAAPALEVMSALPQRGEFVLPAAKGAGHYTGLQKDWGRVRDRAALPGVRIHDLRHSFASFAVADGHSLFLIGSRRLEHTSRRARPKSMRTWPMIRSGTWPIALPAADRRGDEPGSPATWCRSVDGARS